MLLGPFGLGHLTGQVEWLRWFSIADSAEFAHLAEFGVVFLLFNIGLELSLERLRTLRRLVFGLGAAQVLVSSAAIAGACVMLGLAPGPAIIAGIALALSSTAIVIPLIAQQKRLNSPTGRTSFSILLFQDLAVAPVLFTIAAVSTTTEGSILPSLAKALGQAAIALVLIIVAGRLALRPLFHLVAQTRSPELFMAACLLVIVVTAMVSATSGVSMALGAFVAGLCWPKPNIVEPSRRSWGRSRGFSWASSSSLSGWRSTSRPCCAHRSSFCSPPSGWWF
jgi:CPA2 family monovalent cation:H+ antiporter-2